MSQGAIGRSSAQRAALRGNDSTTFPCEIFPVCAGVGHVHRRSPTTIPSRHGRAANRPRRYSASEANGWRVINRAHTRRDLFAGRGCARLVSTIDTRHWATTYCTGRTDRRVTRKPLWRGCGHRGSASTATAVASLGWWGHRWRPDLCKRPGTVVYGRIAWRRVAKTHDDASAVEPSITAVHSSQNARIVHQQRIESALELVVLQQNHMHVRTLRMCWWVDRGATTRSARTHVTSVPIETSSFSSTACMQRVRSCVLMSARVWDQKACCSGIWAGRDSRCALVKKSRL